MNDIDQYVRAAFAKTEAGWSEDAARRLEARLASEPTPAEISRGHDRGRAAVCISFALVAGFVASAAAQLGGSTSSTPSWPSAALKSSPSVLLLSDSDR